VVYVIGQSSRSRGKVEVEKTFSAMHGFCESCRLPQSTSTIVIYCRTGNSSWRISNAPMERGMISALSGKVINSCTRLLSTQQVGLSVPTCFQSIAYLHRILIHHVPFIGRHESYLITNHKRVQKELQVHTFTYAGLQPIRSIATYDHSLSHYSLFLIHS